MASRRPLVRASGGNRQLPSGDTLDASVTGNAATATKLATARTLSWSGDVTGSTTYDGSANSSAALTLANSGVAAGTYGPVTVNAKGLVVSASASSPSYISSLTVSSYSSVAGGSPFMYVARYRGTQASPSAVLSGDRIGAWSFQSYGSDGVLRTPISIEAYATEDVTSSGCGALVQFSTTKTGSTSRSIAMQINGAGLVNFPNGSAIGVAVQLPTYTLSTLPSASAYSGYEIVVSNASRGWALCRSNGTSWIDLYTQAAVA